jgi:hypothetical protein
VSAGSKCWIAVASAEHVRAGVAAGIMQVCHGKAAPLRRVRPGDRVAYYSPTTAFRGNERLQTFTAYGRVRAGEPYVFDMGGGFRPWRRDVAWERMQEASIRPLLDRLSFSAGAPNWGYRLRFGLFEIAAGDMDMIADALGVGVMASA